MSGTLWVAPATAAQAETALVALNVTQSCACGLSQHCRGALSRPSRDGFAPQTMGRVVLRTGWWTAVSEFARAAAAALQSAGP